MEITRTPERVPITGPSNGTIYVHLCSGEVVEVSPATGVRLTANELLVLEGEKVAATFSRHAVYLTADAPMEPPFCG